MPKGKGTRLSLTLPGPLDANEQSEQSIAPGNTDVLSPALTRVVSEPTDTSIFDDSSLRSPQKSSYDLPPEPRSPQLTSLPPIPPTPQHSREASRSLFSNITAAKSSSKIPGSSGSVRVANDKNTDESTEQPTVSGPNGLGAPRSSREGSANASSENLRINTQSLSEASSDISSAPVLASRTHENTTSIGLPAHPNARGSAPPYNPKSLPKSLPATPKTPGTKKSGSMFAFMKRNPSHHHEEHPDIPQRSEASTPTSRDRPAPKHETLAVNPLAANDPQQTLLSQKSGFLKALKTGTTKAVSGYKKGREKLLRGANRPTANSPLSVGQQFVDPDYEMQIIHRPLLDQVRLTRIAPRLEQSRDKTEFWLPSLPWRCIDYLNFKGVEEEGIYRHSGSQVQINYYKQKFDRERDVDLHEEADLYDVNTVSSLLKAWFRDLPDELFPSALQEAVIAQNPNSATAPEQLKEVISNLEPWRYYLLFAITCHLALITQLSEKNKMNIENLHTCIGRSLRIERVVFFWLVGDWRNCWISCTRENEYVEAEYAWLVDENAQLEGDLSNPPSRQDSDSPFPDMAHHPLAGSQTARAPSPGSQAGYRKGSIDSRADSRLGSSSSRQNMGSEITYALSSTQNNAAAQVIRPTGSRKLSQPDVVHTSRSFSDRMHQHAAANASTSSFSSSTAPAGRERSPMGRRPARPDTSASRGTSDDRARTLNRRAQSQPRSENGEQRGKSPNGGSGAGATAGRRRRGETTSAVGGGSPANRSPSIGSDSVPDGSNNVNVNAKGAGGRRRKEGGNMPEIPVAGKGRLESIQREGEKNKKSLDIDLSPRSKFARDDPPQIEALTSGSAHGSESPSRSLNEATSPRRGDEEEALRPKKTETKFRLSAPKFDPISPWFPPSPS